MKKRGKERVALTYKSQQNCNVENKETNKITAATDCGSCCFAAVFNLFFRSTFFFSFSEKENIRSVCGISVRFFLFFYSPFIFLFLFLSLTRFMSVLYPCPLTFTFCFPLLLLRTFAPHFFPLFSFPLARARIHANLFIVEYLLPFALYILRYTGVPLSLFVCAAACV